MWLENIRFRLSNLKRRAKGDVQKAYSETIEAFRTLSPTDPAYGDTSHLIKQRRKARPTLVQAGGESDVGSSRVSYRGANIPLHLLTKDFFITIVNLNIWTLFAITMLLFLSIMFFWSGWYYLLFKLHTTCFSGPNSEYVDALLFSVVTQMTIGYGNTAPDSCWPATFLVIIQSILGIVIDAVVLGIIFAKISHPHQRSRSIFISNKAVISRRDGILKFMFRIADVRNAQVVEPKVRAYLYTWGEGRITAESERIPVRVESIELDYIDGMLLLPLIIEHTIDERSPLCGHTHSSLIQMRAEIVVTFEGTTEMGNPFMTRRSYVPEEIFWGYQFQNVVHVPDNPLNFYTVDLGNFHTIKPQKDIPEISKEELSTLVVNRSKKTVPYPLLGENTLVLSDVLCISPNESGTLCLYCRVGDTYPDQMIEIIAKVYLYRWRDLSEQKGTLKSTSEPFEQIMLSCGYKSGADRIHLRLPTLLTHEIDSKSPLKNWLEDGGLDKDVHSEIVVVINAYKFTNGHNMLRQRTYSIRNHVKYGYKFMPMVKHPLMSADRKPRVRWQHFHDVVKCDKMERFPLPPSTLRDNSRQIADTKYYGFQSMNGEVKGLERYMNELGGSGALKGKNRQRFMQYFSDKDLDMGNSLPPPLALHPALPGVDRFREAEESVHNDLTVGASDLHRYSAAVGTDSLPGLSQPTFTPLPADFREFAAEAQLSALEEGKRHGEILEGDIQDVAIEKSTPATPSTSGFQDEEDAGPIHLENRESQNRSLAAFASLLKEGQGEESNLPK